MTQCSFFELTETHGKRRKSQFSSQYFCYNLFSVESSILQKIVANEKGLWFNHELITLLKIVSPICIVRNSRV